MTEAKPSSRPAPLPLSAGPPAEQQHRPGWLGRQQRCGRQSGACSSPAANSFHMHRLTQQHTYPAHGWGLEHHRGAWCWVLPTAAPPGMGSHEPPMVPAAVGSSRCPFCSCVTGPELLQDPQDSKTHPQCGHQCWQPPLNLLFVGSPVFLFIPHCPHPLWPLCHDSLPVRTRPNPPGSNPRQPFPPLPVTES